MHIISEIDAADALYDAEQGHWIKLNEEIVLAYGSVYYSYMFAKNVKGANIEAHQNVVLDSERSESIVNFAEYVKGANIEKLEEFILNDRREGFCTFSFFFAKNVDGANIEKHIKLLKEFNYDAGSILMLEQIVKKNNFQEEELKRLNSMLSENK